MLKHQKTNMKLKPVVHLAEQISWPKLVLKITRKTTTQIKDRNWKGSMH